MLIDLPCASSRMPRDLPIVIMRSATLRYRKSRVTSLAGKVRSSSTSPGRCVLGLGPIPIGDPFGLLLKRLVSRYLNLNR